MAPSTVGQAAGFDCSTEPHDCGQPLMKAGLFLKSCN